MKNKNLLRALIIPYIAVLIYWTYRQYVFCTELCNCLYLWSIWDTIELNMGFIITFIVITLAVNYAGTHIIRYGKTRELLSSSTKGTIRRVHKWVNRGLNLVLAYFIIAAIIEILDVDAEYGMLRAFFICAAPALPWIMIQEIINEICKLFVDGIDEEDKEEEEKIEESKDVLAISEEGVCQTEEQWEADTIEKQVEQIEEPVIEERVGAVVQEDNGSESIAPQVTIKEISGRKNGSKAIVFGAIFLCVALIGILVLRSCSEGDTQGSNSGNGDEKETYTIAEYISICDVVSTETIGRNPDAYIGKDVLIEGSIGNTFGVYSIGLWSTSNPITVEYDGTAYNIELNPIGNILNGDYGFVAGRYIGDNTIRAEIIVIYEDRDNDSYEQLISSGVQSNKNSGNEDAENATFDMYEYVFSEEGKTPIDFFESAGMRYKTEPTGRGCEYYSRDIDAWFVSDADYVECYVSGDNSRDYGVTVYGLYIGLEEDEVYSFFEVVNQGNDSLLLWTEDEAGYLEISFAYGKVSELHFYYSYE